MYINKLLVAVDDSEPSQYAIDVGIIIAQRDKCPIIFCVVLDPSLMPQNYGLDSICQLAETKANDILQSALERAKTAGVEAVSKTIYHDACQGIIDIANAENVGMIVMGTHGRTGFARAVLSSVAESVLRRTKTPLCVIRRPPIGIIHGRFLVPICANDLDDTAITYAIDIARNFDSTLLFCTVAGGADNSSSTELLERAKRIAQQSEVQADGVLLERRETIPDSILAEAGIHETDAIVMATHARDGLMRFVKGSVTEAVMRASLIPVVVIR